MLGHDTTSVERVTRTAHRIVVDAVGRSPTVTRRHWEAELDGNGVITSWRMDTWIPSARAERQRLHHTAKFGDKGDSFTRDTGAGPKSFAYQKGFHETVPWNAFVYSTWESLLDAARRAKADSVRVGQYFFEGWEEGHTGYADLVHQPDGAWAISSTGLAGTGSARVDSMGRLLSYSGQGTTYKQEVRRTTELPDIDSITARFAADERRTGVASSLSPRDTVHAQIGAATLTIDYSRPARRGRTLVGELIPYGEVWRTGANAATQLTTTAPIQLAGVKLQAGTYTLFTLPSEQGVQLIINGESGQWGTYYDSRRDIARRPMTVDSVAGSVERYTMRIEPGPKAGSGELIMEWGNFRWAVMLASR